MNKRTSRTAPAVLSPACGTDHLEYGYFFRLHIEGRHYWTDGQTRHWYLRDPMWPISASGVGHFEEDDERQFDCPVNSTHKTGRVIQRVVLDLNNGYDNSPFLPHGDALTILSGELSRKLACSGLEVAATLRCDHLGWRGDDQPDLHVLRTSGRDPLFPLVPFPPEANRCRKCGFEPLVCPGCGDRGKSCPNCEIDAFELEREHRGASDPRIVIPYPYKTDVVDLRRWDGADVFGDGYVPILTYRAVQFLLRTNAYPFKAEPLAVCRTVITPEDQILLDAVMTEPPDVVPS